jgi:hypothetical protein
MDAMEKLTRAVCKIRPEAPLFLSTKHPKGREIGSEGRELAPSGTGNIERNRGEISESLDDFG